MYLIQKYKTDFKIEFLWNFLSLKRKVKRLRWIDILEDGTQLKLKSKKSEFCPATRYSVAAEEHQSKKKGKYENILSLLFVLS